jgi:hypothetical protein
MGALMGKTATVREIVGLGIFTTTVEFGNPQDDAFEVTWTELVQGPYDEETSGRRLRRTGTCKIEGSDVVYNFTKEEQGKCSFGDWSPAPETKAISLRVKSHVDMEKGMITVVTPRGSHSVKLVQAS